MPRPRRVLYSNALYHVYTRGLDRRDIFLDDEDRRTFLRFMLHAKAEFRCMFPAYCLMTNHVHLAVKTPEANLDRIMEFLNGHYGAWFNEKHGREGQLFESRYKCKLILRDEYLLSLVRYIHLNPVKAGMVAKTTEYPWSSRGAYDGGADGVCDPEETLAQLAGDPAGAKQAYSALEDQPFPSELWRRLDRPRNGAIR